MPGKLKWYNFQVGGPVPGAPTQGAAPAQGLVPGERGHSSPSYTQGSGQQAWNPAYAFDPAGQVQFGRTTDAEGNRRATYNFPIKSKYDDWANLYTDVGTGVQAGQQAASNQEAIQALQNAGYLTQADLPQQQDISGIGQNQAAIQALQQQLADLQAVPPVAPPNAPYVPGPNTPNVDTGIVPGGAAQPYIDDYFAGVSHVGELDFSPYQGASGGGASNYGYVPPTQVAPEAPVVESVPETTAPPPQVTAPPVDTLPTETHPATKEYIESQEVLPAVVPTDPTYVNNPTVIPRDEWTSPTVTTPTGIEAPIITPG